MEIKRKTISILSLTLILSLLLSCLTVTDIYATSKSVVQKISSYKKTIKIYNIKTAKLAKKTPEALKYTKKTKAYYKKAMKTKSVKKLRSLRAKAKKAYTNARILDYRRQLADV